MILNTEYAKQIKNKEQTPMGAALSYVIELLNYEVAYAKQEETMENQAEKKFVQAVAKINNTLVETYNKKYGDASGGYIELDQIKTEKEKNKEAA